MSFVALSVRQAVYDNKAFWRNPAAAFFVFIFPLMFLVIFNLVFGNNYIDVPGGEVRAATFYVPAIVALSVINATYATLSQFVAYARDQGRLKRLHGTPMPLMAFLAGRILQSIAVAVTMVALVVAFGVLFYDVKLPTENLPAVALVLAVGAAAFCALGLALAGLIPNAEAGPAVVNGSMLPLMFISNVYIPMENSPQWVRDLASIFPVVHFANALHAAFSPFETGNIVELKDLAVMAAWGVVGVVVAVRYFTWEPRR